MLHRQLYSVSDHKSGIPTKTPERRCSPFATRCAAFGHIVGQTLAQIMQQHVRIRPDQLKALLGLIGEAVGDKTGLVICSTTRGVKNLFTQKYVRVICIAAGRYAQIAVEKSNEIKARLINLSATIILITMRSFSASDLDLRTITGALCKQGRGNADVPGER